MKNNVKIMSVFGTRPEAIKMAPLVLELQKHPEITSTVCITAQHRQMLDSVMDQFGITADYDLDIMSAGQDLTDITTRVLLRMREVLREAKPDMVLVSGICDRAGRGRSGGVLRRKAQHYGPDTRKI